MKPTQLPEELIEDSKKGVMIADLCRKYELSREVIRNQLMKIGVREKKTWGGRRKGCGRKRKERSEIKVIRNQSTREGVKVNPRFKLW